MKKSPYLLILLLVLFMLVSCSNLSTYEKKTPSQVTVSISDNDQNFHIIPLYEEVLNYSTIMKGTNIKDNEQVYIDNVIKPFQKIASDIDVDIGNDYFSYFSPTNQFIRMEEKTIKLLENQDLINSLIKEALLKSSQELDGVDKTIFLLPFSPEDSLSIKTMEGVMGLALSEDSILIIIDPSFLEDTLKYGVAHEYHHTVRMENMGGIKTLLDSFISEGEADIFARGIYTEKIPPWIKEPLSEESILKILQGLKENMEANDNDTYLDFKAGNYSKEIPMWSNYRVGYLIVESYLNNNPDKTLKQVTKLDAKEILEGSDFYKKM